MATTKRPAPAMPQSGDHAGPRQCSGGCPPLGAAQERKPMTEPSEPEIPLGDALESLAGVLQDFDNRGLVIGGVAVSLLAAPRLTADLDAMLLLDVTEIPSVPCSAVAPCGERHRGGHRAGHPDVDRRRVEKWVRAFADALESPELWQDIAPLFPRQG